MAQTTQQNGERNEEMRQRLDLIESMVLEGRRTTQYWGWMFLLWGVAYVAALAWSAWQPQQHWAWPAAMIAAALLSWAMGSRRTACRPLTTISRAIQSIWYATGGALFLIGFGAGLSGHAEPHLFLAAIEVLLGVANVASGLTLRWRGQLAVGLIWWLAGAASLYLADSLLVPVLLAATLIGNVGFGLYLVVLEARERQRTAHA